jgi:hypothetical protein
VTQLLIYSVACFGLAFILGQSKISLPFRLMLEPNEMKTPAQAFRMWLLWLFECPACLGFWTGLAWGHFGRPSVIEGEPSFVTVVTALFTCGSNFLLSALSGLLEGERDGRDTKA